MLMTVDIYSSFVYQTGDKPVGIYTSFLYKIDDKADDETVKCVRNCAIQ